MKPSDIRIYGAALTAWIGVASAQNLSPGDRVEVKLRGVPAEEQGQVNGEYVIGSAGGVRIPGLENVVSASGVSGEQLARRIETAFKTEGIYLKPAVEVIVKTGKSVSEEASFVNVGGYVRKTGNIPFRKGMTLMQALQDAGDRTEFGGRNIDFRRGGKLYKLDYRDEKVKNLLLEPNDIINVKQKGIVEGNTD